jgi:predicted transport protein
MPLFRNEGGSLKKLKALALNSEKTLQQMVEGNLAELMDIHFLASEYTTTFGGRIDTIAVDAAGSPVIIEYKKGKNDNVINQALSYLKWLKTQKPGFFEKLMSDKLGPTMAASIGLDWSSPRVICIAEAYSKFDIDTVEVVPLRIELFRYRNYDGGIFHLDPVNVTEAAPLGTAGSIQNLPAALHLPESAPSLDKLLLKASPITKEIFSQLREGTLAIDESIVEKPTALYVGYRVTKNFAEVHIQKSKLRIHLRPTAYNDPKGVVEQISEGYNWTLDRRVDVDSTDQVSYVLGLLEQSYRTVV